MAIVTKIKLGMPQLSYNGLDEIWLFKYCGNKHWGMLEKFVDMNENNDRFYASFFNVSLQFKTDQSAFNENDILTIRSELFEFNTKIYRSVHKFAGCVLTMDTIFVKKTNIGLLEKHTPSTITTKCKPIKDIGIHAFRQTRLVTKFINDPQPGNLLVFPPSTFFNNVKILYFANYLLLVSISEYMQHRSLLLPIQSIIIHYYGNTDITSLLYGRTKLHDDNKSTTTYLTVNNETISYCEIKR